LIYELKGPSNSAAIHPLDPLRLGTYFSTHLQAFEKSIPQFDIPSKRRYLFDPPLLASLISLFISVGLLQPHETLLLEREPASNHPLVVIHWNLALLKLCNRKGIFMDISDYGRNQDLLMGFKKSCGDTIKFASKNIPFALIQVIIYSVNQGKLLNW
jgi:hypothetical protein